MRSSEGGGGVIRYCLIALRLVLLFQLVVRGNFTVGYCRFGVAWLECARCWVVSHSFLCPLSVVVVKMTSLHAGGCEGGGSAEESMLVVVRDEGERRGACWWL